MPLTQVGSAVNPGAGSSDAGVSSVTLPNGIQDGDLIIIAAHSNSAAPTMVTGGYTSLWSSTTSGSSSLGAAGFYKRAVAADSGAVVSLTMSGIGEVNCVVYRGSWAAVSASAASTGATDAATKLAPALTAGAVNIVVGQCLGGTSGGAPGVDYAPAAATTNYQTSYINGGLWLYNALPAGTPTVSYNRGGGTAGIVAATVAVVGGASNLAMII